MKEFGDKLGGRFYQVLDDMPSDSPTQVHDAFEVANLDDKTLEYLTNGLKGRINSFDQLVLAVKASSFDPRLNELIPENYYKLNDKKVIRKIDKNFEKIFKLDWKYDGMPEFYDESLSNIVTMRKIGAEMYTQLIICTLQKLGIILGTIFTYVPKAKNELYIGPFFSAKSPEYLIRDFRDNPSFEEILRWLKGSYAASFVNYLDGIYLVEG